jgi:hypothetical protein
MDISTNISPDTIDIRGRLATPTANGLIAGPVWTDGLGYVRLRVYVGNCTHGNDLRYVCPICMPNPYARCFTSNAQEA